MTIDEIPTWELAQKLANVLNTIMLRGGLRGRLILPERILKVSDRKELEWYYKKIKEVRKMGWRIDDIFYREISKEQFDRAQENRDGYLTKEDMEVVFDDSERYGYGVYGGKTMVKDGKYVVQFSLGSTCD
ncbi:MAG: hypothetical protein J6Y71_03730 [Ruminococcus sp.]|nr:hypothetical protein [Ruminococcus sp.]